MSNQKRDYDSTVARIAGNIIGHLLMRETTNGREEAFSPRAQEVREAVETARAIVAETKRTEPAHEAEAVAAPEREKE